jgi:hypothetical protein
MSNSLINWEKLIPYDRDQYRSFEELCYQIATTLYEQQGRFTSIDDSGGGDGVEFYLTYPNGEQWGWQAKFYYPNGRLTNSRQASIKDSLQRACEQHPKLTRWFLCTPRNLTPDEQKWFDETLRTLTLNGNPVIPEGHLVQLDNWTESDFVGWMSEDRLAGIKLNFFGELELTREWFARQLEKQLEGVGDKYDSLLHTETYADLQIHQILGDASLATRVGELRDRLTTDYNELRESVGALRRQEPRLLDWQNLTELLLPIAKQLEHSLGEALEVLNLAHVWLDRRIWQSVRNYDWESLLSQMNQTYDNYNRALSKINIGEMEYLLKASDGEHTENERRVRRDAERQIQSPSILAANFIERCRGGIETLKQLREADLHFFGGAGFGKTHLSCHVCRERLESGLPALLILGTHFTTEEPLEKQLLSILDVPQTYSWNDFLRALESVGRAYRTRIPILIDGLNEATVGGVFSKVWSRGLPGICRELSRFDSVVLVTTCRTSYRGEIWNENGPSNSTLVHGFEQNVREAVEKYFRSYKIRADLTATPLHQFRHPIYLKIYCEVVNSERCEEKKAYLGEQSLFETFDAYLSQCNEAICRRLGLHHSTAVVVPALNRLATYLWEQHTRRVSLSKACELIDGKPLDEIVWERSKTRACESEGLLVCRDWVDQAEELFFTYDLLGGYLIARCLVNKHADNLENFFNAEDTLQTLYNYEPEFSHPLHEDIRRSLAAILPAQTNRYLHDISNNQVAFGDSVNALFEIAPRYIDAECTDLVTRLFGKEDNRVGLLERAASAFFHVGHPLNSMFWHGLLQDLPVAARDISWTELVRSESEQHADNVRQFEERCQSGSNFSDGDKARIDLLAVYVLWLLTSTVRPLRDKATRALYWYGRRFPLSFFNLLLGSLGINDPYVPERMLAVGYGVAMARQHDWLDPSFADVELPRWGRTLYKQMFAPAASNATTHILSRDYARRTIEIALLHQHDLLTEEEQKRITPPYIEGGIREWGESEDRDKGKYRNGDAPLGMDFDNYTLGSLVIGRGNYDYKHPVLQKVRANVLWRIYQLGFTLERFSTIDQWIARGNWIRDNDPNKVDRYGKKYSWIAYFELTGFIADLGGLNESIKLIGGERISDADIDPSFPEKATNYQLVQDTYLGSSSVTTQEWINEGGLPDVGKFLLVDELMKETGPWVLLDGYINQEDKHLDRNRFTFIRTLLMRENEAEEIISRLGRQEMKNRWLPEIPENYYLYAGEIPWSDHFRENDWNDLEFTNGREQFNGESDVQCHDGQFEADRRTPQLLIFVRSDGDLNIIDLGMSDEDRAELETVLESAQKVLSESKDAFAEVVKRRFPETQITWLPEAAEEIRPKFQALVPLRQYSWESYHSVLNQAGFPNVLARQLTDHLDLKGQPQTFDMFDPNSKRASIAFRHGEDHWNSEHFLYIRRDLLDRFLAEQGLRMVWITWGERQYSVFTMAERAPSFRGKDEAPWRVFQQVTTYPELSHKTE